MRKEIKKLENHPFVKNTSRIVPVILKKAKEIKIVPLSETESYQQAVFQHVGNLNLILENIYQSWAYMEKMLAVKDFREKHDIKTIHWYEYHGSFAITQFVSIRDMMLIITNKVYNLGIEDKHCKEDVILNNSHLSETKIKLKYKKLKKVIQDFTKIRNLFLHRGVQPKFGEILKFQEYLGLELSKINELVPETLSEYKNVFKSLNRRVKDEFRKKLYDTLLEVMPIVFEIFDELNPVYSYLKANLPN